MSNHNQMKASKDKNGKQEIVVSQQKTDSPIILVQPVQAISDIDKGEALLLLKFIQEETKIEAVHRRKRENIKDEEQKRVNNKIFWERFLNNFVVSIVSLGILGFAIYKEFIWGAFAASLVILGVLLYKYVSEKSKK